MKRAFTMIELVFVIVIIGILAAVAIPKLNATRDDAVIAAIVANTRTVLGDMSSFYTSQGASEWENNTSIVEVTRVPLAYTEECTPMNLSELNETKISPNVFTLCDDEANPCVIFSTHAGGLLSITTGSIGSVCSLIAADPSIVTLAKDHDLGGNSIVRK